jgi:hypothetical protein
MRGLTIRMDHTQPGRARYNVIAAETNVASDDAPVADLPLSDHQRASAQFAR